MPWVTMATTHATKHLSDYILGMLGTSGIRENPEREIHPRKPTAEPLPRKKTEIWKINFRFVVRNPKFSSTLTPGFLHRKMHRQIGLHNPSCKSNSPTGCRFWGDFEWQKFQAFFFWGWCFNVNLTVFFVVSMFQLVGVFNWLKFQCVQIFSRWILNHGRPSCKGPVILRVKLTTLSAQFHLQNKTAFLSYGPFWKYATDETFRCFWRLNGGSAAGLLSDSHSL